MILYVLNKDDAAIKDARNISSYDIKEDIDFTDVTSVTIADYIDVVAGDFAVLKKGKNQVFFGICKKLEPISNGYKLTLKQKECMFDTTIYKDEEELISMVGLEDYIAKLIKDNFTESGDPLMDMGYIHISASTHTQISAKAATIANTEDGIFNLKTFLGNARQKYGIFLDFKLGNKCIEIDVNCKGQTVLNVDTKLPEVSITSEIYEVDVLAKLIVKWKKSEDDETPETKRYYLRSDRTITEDTDDTKRVDGTVKTISVLAEMEAEMYQQALNEFKANAYNHSVTAKFLTTSKIYDTSDFFIGRKCRILTKVGVKESMITEMSKKQDCEYVEITFGNLPVKLTRKIRKGA